MVQLERHQSYPNFIQSLCLSVEIWENILNLKRKKKKSKIEVKVWDQRAIFFSLLVESVKLFDLVRSVNGGLQS